MANVNCLIDIVYNLISDSSSLQSWSSTDSTSVSDHLFKYAIEQDYIMTIFPQILISNENDELRSDVIKELITILLDSTLTVQENIKKLKQ
jgi:hypothetical protein